MQKNNVNRLNWCVCILDVKRLKSLNICDSNWKAQTRGACRLRENSERCIKDKVFPFIWWDPSKFVWQFKNEAVPGIPLKMSAENLSHLLSIGYFKSQNSLMQYSDKCPINCS